MALMSESDRQAVAEEIISKNREGAPDGVDLPEWLIFVGAIDDWVESQAAEFNQAIPQPFRSGLTPR